MTIWIIICALMIVFGVISLGPTMPIVVIGTILVSVLSIVAIGELWYKTSIQHIPTQLNHPHENTRLKATKTLAFLSKWRLAPQIVELLLKALRDTDWHVRYEAAQALQRVLETNKEYVFKKSVPTTIPHIVSGLLARIEDPNASIQSLVLTTIQHLHKDSRLIRPVFKALEGYQIPSLQNALNNQNVTIQRESTRFLGYTKDIQAIPSLVMTVHKHNSPIRAEAERALIQVVTAVHTVVFGRDDLEGYDRQHTLYNPDVTQLTVPLSHLQDILMFITACRLEQLETFIQYMLREIGEHYLHKSVRVEIHENIGQFPLEVYNSFGQCKQVDVFIESIHFGAIPNTSDSPVMNLHNPDLSNFMLPLSRLKQVMIETDSSDFHHLERFLTYAVNYLGQAYLKKEIEIHVYGNPAHLHQNIWNNLSNLCDRVFVHHPENISMI